MTFTGVRHHTPDFRFETSNIVERRSATLHKDGSFILTHTDYRLAASASQTLVITSSVPLGTGYAALRPSAV